MGATFGTYRILGELGTAGPATVFSAADGAGGRTVALSVLAPHLGLSAHLVTRFFDRDAAAPSPSYADVIDSGLDDGSGSAFFVMPWREGHDLADHLARVAVIAEALAMTSQDDRRGRAGGGRRAALTAVLPAEESEAAAPAPATGTAPVSRATRVLNAPAPAAPRGSGKGAGRRTTPTAAAQGISSEEDEDLPPARPGRNRTTLALALGGGLVALVVLVVAARPTGPGVIVSPPVVGSELPAPAPAPAPAAAPSVAASPAPAVVAAPPAPAVVAAPPPPAAAPSPTALPPAAAGAEPAVVAPPAAPATEAVTDQDMVTVRIANRRPGTVVSVRLDGRPAALPLRLPRGPTMHSVRVHVPGFVDEVFPVSAARSSALELHYQPDIHGNSALPHELKRKGAAATPAHPAGPDKKP